MTSEMNMTPAPAPTFAQVTDRIKTIDIEGSQYHIYKFDAKFGIKTARLLVTKVLPFFKGFSLDSLEKIENASEEEMDNLSGQLQSFFNVDNLIEAFDRISDDDLEKLINVSLVHCYKQLPAGAVQVLKRDGKYGVPNIEYDYFLVLRLTAEALIMSMSGFFDLSRMSTILSPLKNLLPKDAEE